MLEPLLKVFVAGADRPPEPAERVLHVPLDQFPTLRVGAPHFHQLLGRLAVFRELLSRFALENCEKILILISCVISALSCRGRGCPFSS